MPPGDIRGLLVGTGLNVFRLGQGVFVPPVVIPHIPISHQHERIMFGLFYREPAYATAPTWATSGCRMTDYDHNSAHAIWDDVVEDNTLLGHVDEYSTHQELVRQSVRLPYVEPRAHPNTLGGLLTLALGQRVTTQDGALQAYRHALTLAGGNVGLSMAAQVVAPPGQQYLYTGLKANSLLLRTNGAFLTLACDMLGSGSRALATETFPAIVDDPWLRWGDCKVWLKDVSATPLTVPATPVQGSTNLGVGAVDISTRIVRLEYFQPCHLWEDGGYRPSSGMLRASLYPTRREAGMLLELDVDSATEAADIGHYLQQHGLALEWQCVGTLIAPGGTYRYGFTLLLPRLQWRRVSFGDENAVETFAFEGVVMDDGVNAGVKAWAYTSKPRYLAAPEVLVGCVAIATHPTLSVGLLHCFDLNEASGTRLDHVSGQTLVQIGGTVGSEPGIHGQAATFVGFPANRILRGTTAGTFLFQPPFTVAFWARFTLYPSLENATFVGNGASQNAGQFDSLIGMDVFTHRIFMNCRSGSGGVVTHPTVITLNAWHLVVAWHTTTQVAIQLDNGTIASAAGSSFTPTNFGFTVGGLGITAGTYGLRGAMDTVIVWTRAITVQGERDVIWGGGSP